MTILHLANQPIPPRKRCDEDGELLYLRAKNLAPCVNGKGDCIEVYVNPLFIRRYTKKLDGPERPKFEIRKISITTWRIWRTK